MFPVRGETAFVAAIPVPASPSGGASKTRLQVAFAVEPKRAFLRQGCRSRRRKHFRQKAFERTRNRRLHLFVRVEKFEHLFVIGTGFHVHGKHSARVSHAKHFLPAEDLVDVARESREMVDLRDMLFAVQNRLVKMSDAPSLRNRKIEQIREFLRSLSRNRVSPCAERNQKPPLSVERQIAVHHRAYSHRL